MEMLSTRNFQKPNDNFWSISLKTVESYKNKGKGYNVVIENAKERYKSGEKANFELIKHIYIEENEIPF